MKIFWLVLLSFASVLTKEYPFEDGIAVLTESDFEYAFARFRYVVVQFYTGSLTNEIQDHYAHTAQNVAEVIPEVTFCKFNVTNKIKYLDAYQLHKFPTLKFFIKSKEDPRDYKGNGNTEDIITWLRKELDSLTIKVTSNEELEKVVSEKQNVGFYVGSKSSAAYQSFLGVLPSFDDVAFVTSDDTAFNEHFGVKGNMFVMSRNHGEEKNFFKGEFSVQALKKFIETYKLPLFIPEKEMTREYMDKKHRDVAFFIKDSDEGSEGEEVFKSIAKEFREKLGFTIVSTRSPLGYLYTGLFQLKDVKLPVAAILRSSDKRQRYILDRDVTPKNLKIFLENFFRDNLIPLTKSASVPLDEYDGDVRVVVQKNYKEVVLDESNDVMIEFYSPYCSYCTRFAPTYAAFATAVKDVENLIIAKIDATKNQVEDVGLRGYPSVLFYPRGKKGEPVDYIGPRTQEGLIEFIKEQGTVMTDE